MWTDWTEALVSKLITLWREGRTARQVGVTMGLSRNAVIGKLHRLGEKSPYADVPNARSIFAKRGAKARKKNAPIRPPKLSLPKPKPLPKPKIFIGMPAARATGAEEAIRHLRHDDCRWPIGDPRADDFRFCGAPVDDARSYCPHHYIASINLYYRHEE